MISNKLLLGVKQQQNMSMSQQLRQAIELLQYATIDLKQLVKQQIEINPLLEVTEDVEESLEIEEQDDHHCVEEEWPDNSDFSNYTANLTKSTPLFENEKYLENIAVKKTLRDYLLEQVLLCRFSERDQILAEAIIHSIDEKGYLIVKISDFPQILANQNVTLAEVQKVLFIIQSFDPTGIGASNLQECLLLQLSANKEKDKRTQVALDIITYYFELLSKHEIKPILKGLHLSQDEFQQALLLIRSLNPYPGLLISENQDDVKEPEVLLKKEKNGFSVSLVDSVLTKIKINAEYQELIKKNKRDPSFETLKKSLLEAKNLLSGIKRRNETLILVASYIVEFQKEFFSKGLAYMKPMNISDVASILNLHESTISRITTGKYIATPQGVFELKYFFSSHVATQTGEKCSATAVKSFIKDLIEKERFALSDDDIAAELKKIGVNIARRTVAKYRESLRIAPSYQRNKARQLSLSI